MAGYHARWSEHWNVCFTDMMFWYVGWTSDYAHERELIQYRPSNLLQTSKRRGGSAWQPSIYSHSAYAWLIILVTVVLRFECQKSIARNGSLNMVMIGISPVLGTSQISYFCGVVKCNRYVLWGQELLLNVNKDTQKYLVRATIPPSTRVESSEPLMVHSVVFRHLPSPG